MDDLTFEDEQAVLARLADGWPKSAVQALTEMEAEQLDLRAHITWLEQRLAVIEQQLAGPSGW